MERSCDDTTVILTPRACARKRTMTITTVFVSRRFREGEKQIPPKAETCVRAHDECQYSGRETCTFHPVFSPSPFFEIPKVVVSRARRRNRFFQFFFLFRTHHYTQCIIKSVSEGIFEKSTADARDGSRSHVTRRIVQVINASLHAYCDAFAGAEVRLVLRRSPRISETRNARECRRV